MPGLVIGAPALPNFDVVTTVALDHYTVFIAPPLSPICVVDTQAVCICNVSRNNPKSVSTIGKRNLLSWYREKRKNEVLLSQAQHRSAGSKSDMLFVT